jgi:hypothetical protein
MLAQPLVKSTREFTVRAKMCRNGEPAEFLRKSKCGMVYRAQDPNKTSAWMLSRALEIVDNAVRSPERQRRKSDRRIGGPYGGESAASNQIEVRVIV